MARAPSPETSPEVDFGAFLRPRSRSGVARPISRPVSSYSSYSSAPHPVRPSPTQQKIGAQPQGRMRQGAPRLGGLGLGGLQSSPPPFPSPPASHSPKRKSAPRPAVHGSATPAIRKHDSAVVGRPFLSPEMEKPTLREGAFALDRPVPDLGTSTTPPQDEPPTPDSPSPQPSPFLGFSPPTSPTLDRLGALSAQVEEDEGAVRGEEQKIVFGMMDEVLGLVEAELMGQEERVGELDMSSEEETESEEEEDGSSLASESEKEEEGLVDPKLPRPAAPVETGARSPSPRPSVASLDSFHSLAPAQDIEIESSGSERSFDGPLTPPPSIPSALVAEAVVLIDEPTRSIDEVLLAGHSLSAPKAAVAAPEMDRQPSTSFSDSSSSDVAPSSPRGSMSRGTSRSTSRSRAPAPPRPPRARRPPGSSAHTSPALSQRTFEDEARLAPAEEAAPKEQKEKAGETTEPFTSSPPSRPTLVLTSHSANSSLSMSSQPSDSFFFVPPPPRQASLNPSEAPTALQRPSSPVVAGYEGLGLRLPSSLRPKSFYADPEATPMGSPTRSTASAPLFPPPSLIAAPTDEASELLTSSTSTSTSHEPVAALLQPAEPTLAPEGASTYSSATPTIPPSNATLSSPTPRATPATVSSADDLSSPAEDDSGLADIGVAAVGALVTGGMAVGYSAWRGLSAAASVGWGWKPAAPAVEQVTSVDEEEEEVEEEGSKLRLPGSLVQEENTKDSRDVEEQTEKEKDQNEVESSVISTEWGEVDFPAPAGFIEAFKEAMAQLGPEDLAANDRIEIDAQEAAHDLALQLHLESSGPLSSASPFSTSLPLSRPFPGPPSINKRASMISLGSKRASDRDGARGLDAEGDDYDELMELVSPLFGTRGVDKSPASRYAPSIGSFEGGRPLSRTLSGSTESSVSSRIPPSFSTSPTPLLSKSTRRPSSTSKGGFFSFGKRRPSIDSSLAPPAPSSSSTSSHRRAMSIDSGSSDSHDVAKLKRRSSLFGSSSVKSSATLSPPIPSSSPIESQIVDTTYVSYSSGKSSRRRNSSASTASLSPSPSSPPPLCAFPSAFHKTSARRSSIRLESRYTTNAHPVSEGKKIYTVRFANAGRGIGLRSVAEDEAQRAGGDAHAVKWVGVGRGNRYGNLLIQTDAETDEAYAEQVAEIKTKWRRFGGAQRGEQRDWARVKID